jgi:hypothetical protein
MLRFLTRVVAVAIFLVMLASPAVSQIPVIVQETTNYSASTLTLVGSSFGSSKGTAQLGTVSLVVQTWTNTEVVAAFSAATAPGSRYKCISVFNRLHSRGAQSCNQTLGSSLGS